MSMHSLGGKRILVIGGAGAIGTNLTRELAPHCDVTVLDNLSSGRADNLTGCDARLFVADIRDRDKLQAIFGDGFDAVFHLAAHFANRNSIDYPESDRSVNIDGTMNVLQASHAAGSRVVYASSSCVYGGGEPPFRETDPVDDLHTPYAVSKYAGELYTRFWAEHHGTEAVSLRFFNSFGPFDPPGPYRNVLPNFIRLAMRGEPIRITGDGSETRDFNFVGNTVRALINAASTPFDALRSHVYNVGSGVETSILELARSVIALTNSDSPIEFVPRRGWDRVSRRLADISLARRDLSYDPSTSLEEGLTPTVEWMTERDWD